MSPVVTSFDSNGCPIYGCPPLNQAITKNLPINYYGTVQPWTTSFTFSSETPREILSENILIGFDEEGCPIYLCRFTLTINGGRGVNLREYLNYDLSAIGNLDLIFRFEGNTGAKDKPDASPAIDTGDWPAGTTLKIINGPVIGGGCNPTAGVIAGRGDGYCGGGGKGTAAIHVRAGIHLIIVNDGKIGGGGGVGGDTGGPCGEGGPGAGIPAGTNNGGGGGNTCCGGEGPASVLCGGNGGGGSGSGGNLGNPGGCGSYCQTNANPAIKLGAGASFAFDAISSRPFFEGQGIVTSL
jgi:hypothetical protein